MERRIPVSAAVNSGDWLVGGGEMGELIRAMDWSRTPLGPRESWPQSLRTIINLCLSSNFPIAIAWGPRSVQLYNDGYRPICGDKHPASMGQDFRECWRSGWPMIGKPFARATAGHSAFLENLRVFLDRNGYIEESFFTASFSPIHDDDGHVGGVFHPITEVTQQLLGERRLQTLRQLAEATAGAHDVDEAVIRAAQALSTHDTDLPFVLFYLLDHNGEAARLAGSAGLPGGTPASPERVALDAGDAPWPIAKVLASGRPAEVDSLSRWFASLACGPYPEPIERALVMPIAPSGTEGPLGIVVAGVSTRRDLDDPYRGFFALLSDGITTALSNARAYALERQRAEALAEIDRAKTDFFSNVSHEFRTPLTLMLGPLEETLTDDSRALAPADWRRIDTAHRNALRLQKLVNTLLDFSRIEAGRVQANYRPTDLAAATADLASMFRAALENVGLTFVVDCPPLPEPVYIDTEMWEKIVLNLLSNAFKFTFEGQITVRLRWRNGAAVLSVSDTGIGVAPEHLPHLFERFHRIPNVRSRTYEGSGIGLALVNELVKLHDGHLQVHSEVGRGSTFTVTIPGGTAHLPAERLDTRPALASTAIDARAYVQEALHWLPEPVTDHGHQAPALASLGSARRARILVADDNADMRRYLHGLLSPHWEVELASDGRQALAAIQREVPDLVLTDVMMPKLDGFGLLAALRADERAHATPVVLLSARAGKEARIEGLEAGADDYVVKPFDARELVTVIKTHLDIAGMHRHAVLMAQHDALTGLPNRALTYEFTERLIAAARRGKTQVAVLFIDMDRFKPINDNHGHEVGDEVLREIGRRLRSSVRGEDTVGRLGGDEFLAVFPCSHGASDAIRTAQHLIANLGRPYQVGQIELHTSPSIGIALFPQDGSEVDALVKNADLAMYRAKERGRNNFRFFTPGVDESTQAALRLEQRLRGGITNGEFALDYQPIIDVAGQLVVGAEALLRWPSTGIGPDEFIPVAEASGLIGPLGEWVVREVCRQAQQWQAEGLAAITLSINVSPLQLRQPSLPDTIVHALAECSIAPGRLQLEFTESALSKDPEEAIAAMQNMKRLGLKIALDDFGQGYASLSHLSRMPLDTIKVDQAFVRSAASERASTAVVDAVVTIGKTLGVDVVAEGIESEETLATLRNRDCSRMQGHYLCPPMAPTRFASWYRTWQASPA